MTYKILAECDRCCGGCKPRALVETCRGRGRGRAYFYGQKGLPEDAKCKSRESATYRGVGVGRAGDGGLEEECLEQREQQG